MNHIELLKKRIKEQGTIVERFPGVMNTFYPPVNALINILNQYGYSWEFGYFGAKEKMTIVFFGEKRMQEIGRKLFQEELQEPGHYQRLREEWEKADEKYYNFVSKLEKLNFSDLKFEQLKENISNYVKRVQSRGPFPLLRMESLFVLIKNGFPI